MRDPSLLFNTELAKRKPSYPKYAITVVAAVEESSPPIVAIGEEEEGQAVAAQSDHGRVLGENPCRVGVYRQLQSGRVLRWAHASLSREARTDLVLHS